MSLSKGKETDEMFDLIVIGHFLKEKIIFSDGKEIGPVLGSPAAYTSVAAAKLGLKTGLVTKIGKDMPEELLKVFKEAGVDTKGIKIGDNTTANYLIYERSGKKRLEFLKKADSISFEDIPPEYLDADFFAITPIDYEIRENLIEKLHTRGKKLSMELSGFGGASSSRDKERAEKLEFLKKITRYFKIVKGGEEDYQCLFGDKELRKMAYSFINWGAEISIVTRGEKGVLVLARKEEGFEIPSFPANPVDLTGAGDVWHSGFLFEYLKTKDLKESIIFASALASLLIKKTGGVKEDRFPTCEEVKKRISEENKDG